MSPLLFLAIAVVVPLLGMAVLGVGARLARNRVTDDETEPFRRKLDAIAPRGPEDSPGSPGLKGLFRRGSGHQAVRGDAAPTDPAHSEVPEPRSRPSTSIRLVERRGSLPPLSAERDDRQPPAARPRPRPPGDDRGNRPAS